MAAHCLFCVSRKGRSSPWRFPPLETRLPGSSVSRNSSESSRLGGEALILVACPSLWVPPVSLCGLSSLSSQTSHTGSHTHSHSFSLPHTCPYTLTRPHSLLPPLSSLGPPIPSSPLLRGMSAPSSGPWTGPSVRTQISLLKPAESCSSMSPALPSGILFF